MLFRSSIQPLEQISKLANFHNILFHTDAVQAIGKIPLSLKSLEVDFLTFSGHKVYAPKGSGVLYAKDEEHLHSLLHGGGHERNLRAGTENISAMAGLAAALSAIATDKDDIGMLSDYLWQGLNSTIKNIHRNGDPKNCLPGTLNISFPGVDAEALAMNLDLAGIAVSIGSACSTGSKEPSGVLSAMGLEKEHLTSSLRLSLGLPTTVSELDIVIETLRPLVKKLRRLPT